MTTLAVVIVSHNDVDLLRPCLTSVHRHAGPIELDVVIADNSTDGSAQVIPEEFPSVRVVRCQNRGFGHANNRAVLTCDAPYVLFLNPDTELLDGRLSELVAMLEARPEIGLLSVRQLTADGALYPTIRRFPDVTRAFGECVGAERLPRLREWLGSRVLAPEAYDRETEADWLTGAFMLLPAEALRGAGLFDERFFMSAEETDLALRVRQGGWRVVHSPRMTILHHIHMGKPLGDRMEAQYAFSRMVYADKHFRGARRRAYLAMVRCRHRARLLASALPGNTRFSARADRWALAVLRGDAPPPFGPPPATAVEPDRQAAKSPAPASLL